MPEYKARLCTINAGESITDQKRAIITLHFRRDKTIFRFDKIGSIPQIRALHKQLEFDKLYRIYTNDNIHVIEIKEVRSENKIRTENLSGLRQKVFPAKSASDNG